jgi:glutamate/tyrosine decarboxylase-like PLP-dependent enzyme
MNLHGIITSGGSLANITSLFCARNKGLIAQGVTPEQLRDDGASAVMHSLGYKDAVILVSRLAHYSIKKAAALLGIGLNGLIIIEQDEHQRVKTDVLAQVIAQCSAQKRFIIAIIGIAGATETGTIDPLVDMANIAQSHNIHFHVDAAWGGAFMFSDMYKHKLLGIERADSITFCAHKQLYLAQGISLCVFKDPKSIFAITTHADYQAAVGSYDLGQFTIEGSRPASSLLLHASLHLLAKDGYGWLIQRSMQRTAYFRQLVQSCDAFELVGDNDLNIINYRYIPFEIRNTNERYCEQYTNSQNQQISAAVDAIQQRQFDEGKTFVSQTKIVHQSYSENKITVFRVVLSNPKTSPEDLFEVLQDQLRIASRYIENQPNQLLLSTQAADIAIEQSSRYATSIGKPIDKVKLYILDQQMNLVPNGVIGEIYVAGQCLSAGYLNDSKLTEQCFINNPFATGLLYKSGDLARRMRDGNIEFSGRQDHQINIDGLRVELSEIELILNQSKWVRQAVVLARRDFNQKQHLVAFIVVKSVVNSVPLSDDKPTVLETIRSELAKRLPNYMMPASFEVIESMPLTVNGKVDFKQLL